MSDRYAGFLVSLAADIKDDDAADIIKALMMVKGVIQVRPVVANSQAIIGQDRADVEWRRKISSLLEG